jgi:4-hydroxy-tetrahydrodipicolinate synthase
MKENGDINYDSFRNLIQFQIEGGVHGLVPLGSTGETATLLRDEQDKLIKISVEEVRGKLPVIVGTGSNSTLHTIENTKRAKDLGADAALVVTPYYNKPNDAGVLAHFEAVAAAVDIPIVVYNIASRTAKNITPKLMKKLVAIPSVIGIKESSGDLTQIGDMMNEVILPAKAAGKNIAFLSGDDASTLPISAMGGDGVVSVVSNLVPARIAALCRACLSGNFDEARRLHYELLPFLKGAFIDTNPIPIKAAMNLAGLDAGTLRLPLLPLAKELESTLKESLKAANIETK